MFGISIKNRHKELSSNNIAKVLVVVLLFVVSFSISLVFNAKDFSKTTWNKDATDGNIGVIANDDAFSSDVKMVVEKSDDAEIVKLARSAAGQGNQDVYAYDISFLDKDGNETQPNSRVKVTISPKDYKLEADRYALVHIDDNYKASYLGNIAKSSAGSISFYADSFSIYAIIPTRETDQERYARYTYEFYVDDEVAASQIVRDGDILNAPAAPMKEALIFMGWYTENNRVFNELNQPVSIPDTIKTDKTIKLHARFADKIYSVLFYNPQGNVLATKTGTTGDTFDTDEYRYEVSTGYFVESWTTDPSVMDYYDLDVCDHHCSVPNTVQPTDEVRGYYTFANYSLKLYPVVREVQWIHYHTNDHDSDEHTGASYTPADYAFYGTTVDQPSNPTRNGYDFIGWTTDQAGNNSFSFSTPLTQNYDLYAQWRPHTNTQYRIVFWKEALDENNNYVEGKYEFAAYIDNTGTSGSTITVSQTQINQILNQSDMKYYELDHAESGAVLFGDGSTVVNVYLKLHVYTINFIIETTTGSGNRTRYCLNYNNTNGSATTLCQSASYATDNSLDIYYTNGSPHDLKNGYSFEARMGQNISALYPGVGQIVIDYTGSNTTIAKMVPYAWRAQNDNPSNTIRISKPITMTSDLIRNDGQGATLYLINTIATTHVVDVNYWFEKPDGSGYERSEDYSFTANSSASNFNGRAVTGYELLSSTPSGYSGSSGDTFNFYYKRNTYSLNFYNYNTAGESHSDIRHGASLVNYDYIPSRPAGLEDAFTFEGWFTTPECIPGTEFDLTSDVMPMSNLMLYAKWENTHFVTVSFNPNGGNAIASQTVLYGEQARAVDDPTRTGYVFVGWRKTDGTFFSFDNIILEDTQLVASWVPFDTIKVDYDPNGGTLIESDNETYVDTSTTAILPAPEEPKPGEYFVGWNVNGRIYYPGNVVMILLSDIEDGSDTLTVVAEWGREVEKTAITYNPNSSIGEEVSFTLEQNEAFTTKIASELGYTKAGHTLVGWNTEPDGSGITLKINTQWAADQRASLPNMLYALWDINCHILTVYHQYADGSQYDETETSTICYDISYTTNPSERDNTYVGTVTSGQASGNMPDEDVNVVYTYTKRDAVVIVKHLDEDGVSLAADETIPYHYDDQYSVSPSPDLTPYYTYTADQPTTGTVNADSLTITFTYTKKNFTLTVKHQLADGSDFDTTQTKTYEYLAPYTALPSTRDSDFEVIRTDGETSGTIRGDTTVVFVYAKKKATITTLHLDINGNELADPVTQTVEYGESYNVTPASDLLDAYNYTVDKPESAEVHGNVTITYTYTIKTFTLKVTHQNEAGEVLSSSAETLDYGTHYKKDPLDRPDYVLVDTAGVTEGNISSNVEITFTYTKKTFTVTVKHIIEDAEDITEQKTVEYGAACPAAPKSELLTEYNYTQSGDACGSSVTSNLTVEYHYTRKHFTLTVRHLNDAGQPIIDDKNSDYQYGQTYSGISVDSEVEKAYTCTTTDSLSGTITSNLTITFNCVKKHFTLTTRHHRPDGSNFADDVIKDDYEYGDSYTAVPIDDPAYNYEVTSGSATGTIEGNMEVIFTYTKKTFTVTVKHIIEDAEDITEQKTVEYGAACPAAPKSELLTEYNYTQSGDACGSSVTSNLTVEYHYTRKRFNLVVRYNDKNGQEIKTNTTEYKYGDAYNVSVDEDIQTAYVCTTTDSVTGMITGNTTITYNCEKRKFTVTTHHIKSDGTEFAADVITNWEYGDTYTTSPIIDNHYTHELTAGSATGTVTSNIEVTYTYTRKVATITVHHVDENGDPLADDVVFTVPYGERYETEPSTSIPANYELAGRSDNYTGTAETDTVEVTYRYQKKDPNLSSTIKIKDGNDTLTNDSSTSEYSIDYSATVGGYLGRADITITNTLPYPINLDESNLNGGTYDPDTNTITWTHSANVTTVPQTINLTKSLKIVFREVNANDRAVPNRASATITLENGNDRTATDDVTINVEIKGAAIVHYYLSGTATSIKDDLRLSGLVGDEFTISVVEIDGYELVSSAPAKTYRYAIDTQEIVFEYTKIIPPSPEPTPDNPVTDDSHILPISLATLPLITTVIIILWRNGRRRA